VVAANTFLPTGDVHPGEAFLAWQCYSQDTPVFKVGEIVEGGCRTDLSSDVVAGYDAPFPDESFKAGARQFPMLVPTDPSDPAARANRAAWDALGRFQKPFCVRSPIPTRSRAAAMDYLASHIPGAREHSPVTIVGGGHFLQEDKGKELADVVASFVSATEL
jgi:haloalkane dehalogenase